MWARLEREAASLDTYECRILPGLLQTEAYARAAFSNNIPLLNEEEMEAQLQARMERQGLLRERANTSFSFIIDEASCAVSLAVRRSCGGRWTTF
jgi:hypothetical protein